MLGKVIYVSPNRGMAVVQNDGGFAVLEMLGCELEIGQAVRGDWEAVAGETIKDANTGESFDVFLECNLGSRTSAIREAAKRGGG